MAQLAILSDELLYADKWMVVLLQMGVSYRICSQTMKENRTMEGNCPVTPAFLEGVKMWLAGEKGTGELPRTRGTVLNALKKTFRQSSHADRLETAECILMED